MDYFRLLFLGNNSSLSSTAWRHCLKLNKPLHEHTASKSIQVSELFNCHLNVHVCYIWKKLRMWHLIPFDKIIKPGLFCYWNSCCSIQSTQFQGYVIFHLKENVKQILWLYIIYNFVILRRKKMLKSIQLWPNWIKVV